MSRVRSFVVSSLVAVAIPALIAAPAFAQDPPAVEPAASPPPVAEQPASRPTSVWASPGLDLGVRLGYALPFGNTAGDEKVSDGLSGAVPVILEAGYRINESFTIGALFQYGFAQVKENTTTGCGGGISCSGSIVRVGVEALYNFNLAAPLTPWVGIGTGYEWLGISLSQGGQSASVGTRGMEFATIHLGGDYLAAPQLALGPFVSFSVGQYATASVEAPGIPSMSQDVTDKKMHEWLQLGIRGKFGI